MFKDYITLQPKFSIYHGTLINYKTVCSTPTEMIMIKPVSKQAQANPQHINLKQLKNMYVPHQKHCVQEYDCD